MLIADVLPGAELRVSAFLGKLTGVLLVLDQEGDQMIHEGTNAIAPRTNSKVEHHMESAESAGTR